MKIFISGPMRGYPNDNKEAFDEAENMLLEKGYVPFNPAWMKFPSEWTQDEILAIDYAAIDGCDAIYQLSGWEKSTGASKEYRYADKANKIILNQGSI